MQRSRINWLKEGDRNSKFFHITTLQRRQHNRLLKLRKENGECLNLEALIAKEIQRYFKCLYDEEGIHIKEEVLLCIPRIVTD